MTSSSISGRKRSPYVISFVLFLSEVHQGIKDSQEQIHIFSFFSPTPQYGFEELAQKFHLKRCFPTCPQVTGSSLVCLISQFQVTHLFALFFSFPYLWIITLLALTYYIHGIPFPLSSSRIQPATLLRNNGHGL